jgi:hypothetical protein
LNQATSRHRGISAGRLGTLLLGLSKHREKRFDSAAKTRNDVLAGQFVRCPKPAPRPIGSKNLDRLYVGIDHPDKLDPGAQVFLDLLKKLLYQIVGRDHLDGEVGRDRAETLGQPFFGHAISPDEGDIGTTNAAWFPGKTAIAKFGGQSPSEFMFFTIGTEDAIDSRGDQIG